VSYRVAYAPPADATLSKVRDTEAFKDQVVRTVGLDPYGYGSTPVKGELDRREVTVLGSILLYYVSGSVLTVTVVRLVTFP
jgi:hypothetical protein